MGTWGGGGVAPLPHNHCLHSHPIKFLQLWKYRLMAWRFEVDWYGGLISTAEAERYGKNLSSI